MRLYLDACALIYACEGIDAFRIPVQKRIQEVAAVAGSVVLTSELSRMECRVKPMKDGNVPLLKVYETLFGSRDVQMVEVNRAVIDRATDLRVRYGFKAPDSIHLASAMVRGADLFLTGDAAFARCSEIKVEVVKGA